MGVSQLEQIVERLRDAGAPSDRPAALIERATLPGQRLVHGTLQNIAQIAREAQVTAPSLLVIGDVVSAAQSGSVFDSVAESLRGVA
jgi:siroheme synthase